MEFYVRFILLIYCRLYLVSCPPPSVLRPFVGGGDLVRPSSVFQAGRDLTGGYPWYKLTYLQGKHGDIFDTIVKHNLESVLI